MNQEYLSFSEEVLKAKREGKPIVALESTIISHGMPYPQNVETAREVEEIIRRMALYQQPLPSLMGKLRLGYLKRI